MDIPPLVAGYMVTFNSDAKDQYHILYKIAFLASGSPYRYFFVCDDGETWHIKAGDLEIIKTVHRPTPEGLVQVWPEVEGK